MFLQFWNWISSKGLQGYALRAKTDKTGDETKEIMRANPSYLQIEPTPDKNIFFSRKIPKSKSWICHTPATIYTVFTIIHIAFTLY